MLVVLFKFVCFVLAVEVMVKDFIIREKLQLIADGHASDALF